MLQCRGLLVLLALQSYKFHLFHLLLSILFILSCQLNNSYLSVASYTHTSSVHSPQGFRERSERQNVSYLPILTLCFLPFVYGFLYYFPNAYS